MSSPTYESWAAMKQRCNNPNHVGYEYYGGRGITYDTRWEKYVNFREDMGRRPDGLTLDRKDGNKNYCKDNCRWATRQEQSDNVRPRTKKNSNNKSGVTGVNFNNSDGSRWWAAVWEDGRSRLLYRGKDFFEACCARKSWEARQS